MIRIIILGIVGYVLYRALKSWMFPTPPSTRSVAGMDRGEIDDVMVKDPFCETYFPRSDAVQLNFEGKQLYFCSVACKDKFVAAQSENKP